MNPPSSRRAKAETYCYSCDEYPLSTNPIDRITNRDYFGTNFIKEKSLGRRKRQRCVAGLPPETFFKPQGVPLGLLKGVILPVEGLEAMRLVDAEGLSQENAALRMGVSTPTLCRILAEARATVARALNNGWAIRIEGGDFVISEQPDLPEAGNLKTCCQGQRRCGSINNARGWRGQKEKL